MKKNKFALLLVAVMAMFSLSSCLDGDNNSTAMYSGYVKVKGFFQNYKFETTDGIEINPLNQGALHDLGMAHYALLNFSYEVDQLTSQTTKLDATLLNIMPIETSYSSVVRPDGEKPKANAPILLAGGYGTPVQFAWNENTMFLPIKYLVKRVADKSEMDLELKSHRFELYYDQNEPDAKKGEIVLHLRHSVMKEAENAERDYESFRIVHFDLAQVMAVYQSEHGELPSTLVIEFEKSDKGIYDDKIESERVTLDYSNVLKGFKK